MQGVDLSQIGNITASMYYATTIGGVARVIVLNK